MQKEALSWLVCRSASKNSAKFSRPLHARGRDGARRPNTSARNYPKRGGAGSSLPSFHVCLLALSPLSCIAPSPALAARLHDIRQRIARVVAGTTRSPRLIAVTKTWPALSVLRLHQAGQRDFGENRVQEAQRKYTELRAQGRQYTLHMVGSLQTNKVRQAVALFDVVHTLDRPRIVHALAKEAKRADRSPVCFVQVNLASEPRKSGCPPHETESLCTLARRLGLNVCGLMCVPPLQEQPSPYFQQLAHLAGELNLHRLSMGMSRDFETAIEKGATDIRLGTAILGVRPKTSPDPDEMA